MLGDPFADFGPGFQTPLLGLRDGRGLREPAAALDFADREDAEVVAALCALKTVYTYQPERPGELAGICQRAERFCCQAFGASVGSAASCWRAHLGILGGSPARPGEEGSRQPRVEVAAGALRLAVEDGPQRLWRSFARFAFPAVSGRLGVARRLCCKAVATGPAPPRARGRARACRSWDDPHHIAAAGRRKSRLPGSASCEAGQGVQIWLGVRFDGGVAPGGDL